MRDGGVVGGIKHEYEGAEPAEVQVKEDDEIMLKKEEDVDEEYTKSH